MRCVIGIILGIGLVVLASMAIADDEVTEAGAFTAEDCAMCHAEGVMGAAKTPENHGDDMAGKCAVCHMPPG